MGVLKLKTEINELANIDVIFSEDKSISIDISEDVDLTELIQEFTFLIGEDVELELQKFETEDQKMQLIHNTIEEIVNSFNQNNVEQDEPEEESVSPF